MKMKSSCSLILFLMSMSMYHARHVSIQNLGIRIPLSKIHHRSKPPTLSLNATPTQKTDGLPIPLQNSQNLKYYGQISIGTPAQKFNVIFDTRFDGLWILSSLCKSSDCLSGNRKLYNHKLSKTYWGFNRTSLNNLTLGEGWAIGFWSKDKLLMGGSGLRKYPFLEATKVSQNYEHQPYDGVMGLGCDSENPSNSIISRLCENEQRKFSIYLTNNKSNANGGELVLCGVDESKFHHPINNVDVTNSWKFPMKKITLHNGKKRSKILASEANGSVSISEPYITGPKKYIQEIRNALNLTTDEDTNVKEIDCEKIRKSPNITFKISNEDYTLTGEDYILKPTETNEVTCILGFKSTPDNDSDWVLGEVFLRKFYTVFNFDKHAIGFAKSIHN